MGGIRLLTKTLGVYLLFSVAVLAIAAPVFYFSIVQLYIEDTDEALLLYKEEFWHYYLPHFKQSEIESYNHYNRNVKIEPATAFTADSFFYNHYLDTLDDEYEPYRVLRSSVMIENKPYHFVARIGLVETEDLIESIAIIFVVLIASLLVVLVLATNRLSKRNWRPFHSTLEKLKSFDLTAQQAISFEKTNIKEFRELNQSVQKLISQNISAYNQQKMLIENASHEWQTPLAVLKSKLNLLLQSKDITQEQSEILAAIELPIARMTRINKNLLLLAKIENNQFADNEVVELSKILQETLELLSDYISSKQIAVEQNISDSQLLKCNKTLTEILLNNLIINSVIHNSAGGKITLTLSDSTLRISNTGEKALASKQLFERFANVSAQNTNSGLGLAIVKEICNRYQWQIRYSFEDGVHSFWVRF